MIVIKKFFKELLWDLIDILKFGFLLFLFGFCLYKGLSGIEQNRINDQKELLTNGNRIESVVVDKEFKEGFVVVNGSVAVADSDKYLIKLYLNDLLKEIEVSKDEYEAIEIGKKLKVIEYKDKIILDK